MLESREETLDLIHPKKKTINENIKPAAVNAPIDVTVLNHFQGTVTQAVISHYYKTYLEQLIEEQQIPEKEYLQGKRSDKLKKALEFRKQRERKLIYRKIFNMHETQMREEIKKKVEKESKQSKKSDKGPINKTTKKQLHMLFLESLDNLFKLTKNTKSKKILKENCSTKKDTNGKNEVENDTEVDFRTSEAY